MTTRRKDESNANFLRRANEGSKNHKIPQSVIQNFDESDREEARNDAYFYLRTGQSLPDYYANDPAWQSLVAKNDMGRSAENQPAGKMDALMQFMQSRGAEMNVPTANFPQAAEMNIGLQGLGTNMPGVQEALRASLNDKALSYLGDPPEQTLYSNRNKNLKKLTPGQKAKRKAQGFSNEPAMNGSLPEDADGMIPVVDAADAIHYHRMDGGDTRIAYTEPGEMVLPKVVGERHPEVRMAIARAIRAEGGDERQYISGDPNGNYDEKTGAQKFAWYDFLTKGADYVANNPWAQSAVTGVGMAGLGKLTGQSTKSALYTGLGAGLGSYVGRGAGNMFETDTDKKIRKALPDQDQFLNKGEDYEGTLNDLKAALSGSFKATTSNRGANYGAGIGAMLGSQNAPPPTPPNLSASSYPVAKMAEILPDEYYDQFKKNESANLSATLPQSNPIAPMAAAYLPEGVTYQDKVRNRETGDYRYNKSNRQDQSAFARAIAGTTARRGRGFGNMILA